jgi:hypothetical protein
VTPSRDPIRSWLAPGPAVALCATAFFLGGADLVFGFRAFGVNVRYANLLLVLGLAAWLWRERDGLAAHARFLAIGWAPFIALFSLSALVSPSPLPGLVKAAWFALNLVGAYAWCRLFRPADLARGYFACYLVLAAILVTDFATGFIGGPQAMIGHGQPNALASGGTLWRPHAFHYEPSYAAAALALAWALSVTRIGSQAPRLAVAVTGLGFVALVILMSRTGWLYVAVFVVLLPFAGAGSARADRVRSLRHVGGAAAIAAVALAIALASPANRERFTALVGPLGAGQTLERICPLLDSVLPVLGLHCLEGEARRRALDDWNRDRKPVETSEGQRVKAAIDAVEDIRRSVLLGNGVREGRTRLIEPVAANVWLEIGSEGGLLSLGAVLWGLGWSLWRGQALAPHNRAIALALCAYFAVAWQFLQTFPRLDQWMSFWFALAMAAHAAAEPPQRLQNISSKSTSPS